MATQYEVAVIGGSFAGLSAALTLGRARCRVLVIDSGEPRNATASHLRTFATLDGIDLPTVRRRMQEDLSRYPVEIERAKAVDVRMRRRCFEIELEGGDVQNSASLIAASGVEDLLPPIRGIEQFWGISVHNCMYCDGWEVRDRRLGVLGSGESGVELSSLLARWSSDLTLFLDDPSDLTADQRARLSDSRVKVEARKIIALVGDPGNPTISLEDGTELRVDGLFIRPPIRPRLEFLRNLLPVDDLGYAEVDRYGRTCVRRLYIAGDASGQLFQAIGAAADGNKVARWLVHDLMTSH